MDARIRSAESAITTSIKLIEEEAASTGGKKDANKSKSRMRKVLAGAQQVGGILDSVAKLHPATEGPINTFKGVIKLEADRRENNEQIVTVCYSMAMMMYALHQLLRCSSPEEAGLDDEFYDRLTEVTASIEQFGSFVNFYYNGCSKLVRLLRAAEFKVRLRAFANTFDEHRDNISFVLTAQFAGGQKDMSQEIQRLSNSLDTLIERLGTPSDEAGKKAQAFISEHGGEEEVIQDMDAVQQVSKLLKDPLTSNKLSALTEDISELLERSQDQFQLKLEGAQLEIQESIGKSTQSILNRLNEGPHDLIEDPDLKQIWKESAWRLSVKVRVFVDGLYDRYSTKFREMADAANGEFPPDNWTLKVFSKIINHPSIGEAIDEDASGFVSVHEVNHFVQKKPPGWSAPLWFAFWAVGWDHLNIQYTHIIYDIVIDVEEASGPIKERFKDDENLTFLIDDYLIAIKLIRYILDWLSLMSDGGVTGLEDLDGNTVSEVVRIAEEYSNAQVPKIEESLKRINFVLDDAAYLPIVTHEAGVRIEQVIMPLLFIILHHHHQTIVTEAARVEELEPKEFGTTWNSMYRSLSMLIILFHERMKSLMRSWRAQKQDVEVQLSCFAGGLFAGWYQEYNRRESDVRKYLEGGDEDSQSEKRRLREEEAEKINTLSQRVDQLDTRLNRIEEMLTKLLSQSSGAGASTGNKGRTGDDEDDPAVESSQQPAGDDDEYDYGQRNYGNDDGGNYDDNY